MEVEERRQVLAKMEVEERRRFIAKMFKLDAQLDPSVREELRYYSECQRLDKANVIQWGDIGLGAAMVKTSEHSGCMPSASS